MGIRLDWEIESEKSGVHTATEDPVVMRSRRQARVRFLATLAVILVIMGGIGALLSWRLHESDARIEQFLRDTIEAEVAALRIGDQDAFNSIQRSADPSWAAQTQQALFDEYQNLKTTATLQLTGTVRDLEIDGTRGRALVEEIIDGAPYVETWFYWRYEDGWRHVPPDYTFWGEPQQYNGTRVTVKYASLDEPVAREIGLSIEGWVESTCTVILECGDFPHITVNLVADDSLTTPVWSTENHWTLRVPSPFMHRVRYDQPFGGQLKIDIADAIARRLVEQSSSDLNPAVYPADAYYLRPAVVSWLVGRFVALNTNAYLITSLADQYGKEAVGRLVQTLRADSMVSILSDVTGKATLAETNLDWRDFLTWRLVLENQLASRGDQSAYLALYDPAANSIAQQRYNSFNPNSLPPDGVVSQAQPGTGSDGVPQLDATVQYTDKNGSVISETHVLFRLIDNIWKRAN